MAIVRALVRIPARSGVARDDMVNTWHFFQADAPDAADFTAYEGALQEFYAGAPTGVSGGVSIANNMSSSLMPQPTVAGLDFYLIDTVTGLSGSPVETRALELGNGGASQAMPDEVAVTLSFAASHVGISEIIPAGPVGPEGDLRPRQSRRGRIFLGRLGIDVGEASSGRVRVKQLFRDTVLNRANAMNALAPGDWIIWSRKNKAGYPVIEASVDDAFDTQRRRGQAAQLRTVAVIP